MIPLNAKIRKEKGKKTRVLKDSGRIPAVLYGHKVENVLLDVDYKEFQRAYKEAGESSLIELNIEGIKERKAVLVHDLQRDPLTENFVHIDFFQTSLTEQVEVAVPLVFEGVSPAVKDLGGTLVKNISELDVKALAQNLPHEIRVNIENLKTFEDHILVKDLSLPENVRAMAKPDEIVASVLEPQNVEADLAEEIEEKVEDIEKIEKEKKEEEVVESPAEDKGTK
jgi:large subunit ribosomal protein L25